MIKKFYGKLGIAEILLALSVLILVIVVAVPILLILWTALFVDGSLNTRDIIKMLSQPETYEALKNSLIIAAGVTFFSTIIGVFFAWLVSRTDLPFKETMKVLFLVPFMLPFLHRRPGLEDAPVPPGGVHQQVPQRPLRPGGVALQHLQPGRDHRRGDDVSVPLRLHPGRRSAGADGPDAGGIGPDLGGGAPHDHPEDHDPAHDAEHCRRRPAGRPLLARPFRSPRHPGNGKGHL